jgi:pimeloyl-ACP methyl ester carboxylesterase
VALGEVAGRLPHVTAPTLILSGARKGPSPGSDLAARSMARATLGSIPDAGVFAHQDNPAAVARAMLDHARSDAFEASS